MRACSFFKFITLIVFTFFYSTLFAGIPVRIQPFNTTEVDCVLTIQLRDPNGKMKGFQLKEVSEQERRFVLDEIGTWQIFVQFSGKDKLNRGFFSSPMIDFSVTGQESVIKIKAILQAQDKFKLIDRLPAGKPFIELQVIKLYPEEKGGINLEKDHSIESNTGKSSVVSVRIPTMGDVN